MCPRHSIDFCPICGGGLCGIRIIDGIVPEDGDADPRSTDTPVDGGQDLAHSHGLVICDECEAIWLEPDTSTAHQYPNPENAVSPVSGSPLWGKGSRWANQSEIESLGWTEAVNPALDAEPEPESDSDQSIA